MFFKLINAFIIFQEFINDMLYDIMNKYIITYLDNILMFINGKFNQYKEHVK